MFFQLEFSLRYPVVATFLSICEDVQGWPGLPSGRVVIAGASLLCRDKGGPLTSSCY